MGATVKIKTPASWLFAQMCLVVLLAAIDATGKPVLTFEGDIKPLLEKRCLSCHNSRTHMGGLVLATLESILQGGGADGPAILVGKSSESPLVRRLRGERVPRMPLDGDPLPEVEIARIEEWIDQMADTPGQEKDQARSPGWPWTKLEAPDIPQVQAEEWVGNPIDAFVLAKLENQGLRPAPPASKRALLRRLYFDLIGLPPTPEEVAQFLNDSSRDAYEKRIETLLADDRYGERWARHWLDLVRYADSEGAGEDMARPHLWRYRDYVVRAFNQDRPYDRFIREQLAGDAYLAYGAEGKIAVGFLNLVVRGEDTKRRDVLVDAVNITGSVFQGITLGCARCHDHKYDPISQRDYYRMEAFFSLMTIGPIDLPFTQYEPAHQDPEAWGQKQRAWEKLMAERKELKEKTTTEFKQLIRRHRQLLPGEDPKSRVVPVHDSVLKSAVEEGILFSKAQRELYRLIERQNFLYGNPNHPDLFKPRAYSVTELSSLTHPDAPTTYVLEGGNPESKGEAVEPGFLSAVQGHQEPVELNPFRGAAGRRKLLADWISSPDNPLTARVLVNRIWQHHFGKGLVVTPNDFGANGSGTLHPELIDWLASHFIEGGWSVKAAHRLILKSNAYRQSIRNPHQQDYQKIDPENRYLWRWNPLRLEAEVIWDSILAVSGQLNLAKGGPGFLPDLDDALLKARGTWWEPSAEEERNRRAIYMWQLRSFPLPLVEVFDGANMSESCAAREVTNNTPQVFALFNSQFVREQSHHMARRLVREVGDHTAEQLERGFQLALQRRPTAAENAKGLAFLGLPRTPGEPPVRGSANSLLAKESGSQASQGLPEPEGSLADLCLVLLNMNEFIFLE